METIATKLQTDLLSAINNKTKPLGALGRLEEMALQIGCIQQSTTPSISNPHVVVFAGDHGIAQTGLVNPYPKAVTVQMVKNFLAGGAAINVFCRLNDIQLKVVDAGVDYDWSEKELNSLLFINAKINKGTRNYLLEEAMTPEECREAMAKGAAIVDSLAEAGCNCFAFGEMGIGNTSSASLIMSGLLQMQVTDCVGRGTGVNDEQLKVKVDTLKKVAEHHRIHELNEDPLKLLASVGGFEIAMICGAMLQTKKKNGIILVDGFIATAALLLAVRINSAVVHNCIFAHTSGEKGHALMMEYLGVKPLLDLGLRLGEGTGAALAIPLLRASVGFLNEMASFESAGVANKTELQ